MTQFDLTKGNRTALNPTQMGFPVTPSDNTALPAITNAIYVGGAGDLTVILRGDPSVGNSKITGAASAITFKAVPAGTWLNIAASYVMATNTTATNILGLV